MDAAQYNNFSLSLNGCISTGSGVILVSPPSPVIDPILSVSVCDSFVLNAITGVDLTGNESYYMGSGGTGVQLNPGDVITAPLTTIYMYDVNGSCSSEESFTITINSTGNPTFIVSDYCFGMANSALVTGTQGGNFTFSISPSDGATLNAVNGSISNGVAGTTYSIEYTTSGVCSSSLIQTVTVNSSSAEPIVTSEAIYCSTELPSEVVALPSSGGIITWYSDNTLTNVLLIGDSMVPSNVTTIYYITETTSGCEGLPISFTVTVQNCDIDIPTAFTPDNDGVNDKWELVNIDAVYPNNTVKIYNRWGSLIFSSPSGAYESNSWDGTFKGKILPVESCYFIIEYNDGEKEPSKGTVSIILK